MDINHPSYYLINILERIIIEFLKYFQKALDKSVV